MSGANFTLDAAKRIVAAVKRVEGTPTDTSGGPTPNRPLATSFWAMITGAADIDGLFHDWIAVRPSKSMATPQQSNILAPSNMWEFQVPYVAGSGNAREANDNRQIPPGVVVLLTFVGYAIPAGTTVHPGTTTEPASSNAPPKAADGSIPTYCFNYGVPQQLDTLPIHDHRDNVTGGGFAFSVYHPGTPLPQQNFSV